MSRKRGDGAGQTTEISLVVPMYNEEQNIAYLLDRLGRSEPVLAPRYRLRLIFVDDGSTDGTWRELEAACRDRDSVQMLRHTANRGVAAAIMTGIRAAETEAVCSMDADCSYDPGCLKHMVPMLENAAMVTASPYHPDGRVVGVSPWRVVMSRTLSWLYRRILRSELHTFTSCFRVYRRSVVAGLELDQGGFLGIAELAIRLLRSGHRVAEYPAVLGRRVFGRSKLRTLRTIRGHLGLLWAASRGRL